eukprot:m.472764 g.472764  ORF g.472764 m.472764 type:complete len:677 (+) comp21663_c0_seq3:135-2165(+)
MFSTSGLLFLNLALSCNANIALLASRKLVISGLQNASTYYVSADAGDDSRDGLSWENSWKTMSRVSEQTFSPGDTITLAAGETWTEPLQLNGPNISSEMDGFVDGITFANASEPPAVIVNGWVVDKALSGGGIPPVMVNVYLDGQLVISSHVANLSRPDLVKAGVAPNPDHGFVAKLGGSTGAKALHGHHVISVVAVGCGASQCGNGYGWELPMSPQCLCDGILCTPAQNKVTPCQTPWAEQPSVRLTAGIPPTSEQTAVLRSKRPVIRLNGTGTAVLTSKIDWLLIEGIEIDHATSGIRVTDKLHDSGGAGNVTVYNCIFRNVFNRSSIGQSIPTPGKRNCYNGWSPVLQAGGGTIRMVNNVFDNFDVAFLASGAMASARFLGNTMTRGNGNVVFFTASHDWLLTDNVFSRDYAPRFFQCGTTDIMVGGSDSSGTIARNEIGWRGEHPASPDGCGIDYEGGSDGVAVEENLIHDSYGAGIMVFGLSDPSRNISNARIAGNIFVRNGAQQMSDDRGEIAFMEHGSTGNFTDNVFFAASTSPAFVMNERVPGTLALGWHVANNTIHGIDAIPKSFTPTPAISTLAYQSNSSTMEIPVECRSCAENGITSVTVLYTTDGSWPQPGAPGTSVVPMTNAKQPAVITVSQTSAVNIRFAAPKMLTSLTTTIVVTIPPEDTE